MNKLEHLIAEVAQARKRFIAVATGLTPQQASFKPSPDEWSITDNVEHMVWAEQGGVNGMWKAMLAMKNKIPIWQGETIHQGLSIEEIIEKTWQPKEQVPESAKPKWGGPVEYWLASLQACQYVLEDLALAMHDLDPEQIIHPHPISGPLNVYQRMEFLRFHLERHQRQIENLKTHPDFPQAFS